ncbi:MAG: ribonuclease P protein subunit [Candidatus Woesearchaeota archaeon]
MATNLKIEFIGQPVEIIKSRNRQLVGLSGKIVDETKQSFKILINKRTFREFKLVFKKDAGFIINGKVIDGNKILKRPEERIKLKE